MKRGDIINLDEIWFKTDGGRTIWEQELGCIPTKKINSPLRNDGKIPAFSLFQVDGKWLYKDFGGKQESGDIIKFLQKRYSLTYRQALEKIRDNISLNPIIPIKSKPKKKQKLHIDWEDMKFSDNHKRYFGNYELDETFVNSMDIYALNKYAINGNIVKTPKDWYRFIYYAKDINEVKVLTLGNNVPEIEKWRSFNIPDSYLWYYYRYISNPCDDLFIVKSNKDSCVMSKLGYCCIATQSENATTLISNKNKIEAICKYPYIVFGSDKQGKQASLDANKVLNWRYFNTKNYLLKDDINDPASFVEGFGLITLDRQIKKDINKWK